MNLMKFTKNGRKTKNRNFVQKMNLGVIACGEFRITA